MTWCRQPAPERQDADMSIREKKKIRNLIRAQQRQGGVHRPHRAAQRLGAVRQLLQPITFNDQSGHIVAIADPNDTAF